MTTQHATRDLPVVATPVTTAVVPVHHTSPSFTDMIEMGKHLVSTGFLNPAIKSGAQAAAIIQTGSELGIPPMFALNKISIIEGKPALSAELMLALLIRSGIIHKWIKCDETEATLLLKREKWPEGTFTFTLMDAKRAGLNGVNWQKYPAAMLRARVISLAARAYAPDVLGGISYTPEELGATVDMETGEVIATPTTTTQDVVHVAEVIPAAPSAPEAAPAAKIECLIENEITQIGYLVEEVASIDRMTPARVLRQYSTFSVDGRAVNGSMSIEQMKKRATSPERLMEWLKTTHAALIARLDKETENAAV